MSELSRLRWRCRLGMRELDLLLEGWLDAHYQQAPAPHREAFAALLELPAPELCDYLSGRRKASQADLRAVLLQLRHGR